MAILFLAAAAVAASLSATTPKRNVLYVVFDDLRPDLSAYDVPFMKTPHIQRLADTGTLFERAYCQEAVCSPSRNSFTTGRRPNSTRVWNFIDHLCVPPLRFTRFREACRCPPCVSPVPTPNLPTPFCLLCVSLLAAMQSAHYRTRRR
eukprot:SAG25_NODE_840_length_5120_cov_3.796455_6_plen_148_part_00